MKALHEVGLEPEFVTMFVSNSIQDLVLTRANEVPARDKIANTTAGADLIALLDAIDKTVSDPERGHTWIPSVAKAGCAALRVLCDVENTSLDAVSDVCKVFGPQNPRMAEMTPKGDLVFDWLVNASRGRQLLALADAYLEDRGPEVALAHFWRLQSSVRTLSWLITLYTATPHPHPRSESFSTLWKRS